MDDILPSVFALVLAGVLLAAVFAFGVNRGIIAERAAAVAAGVARYDADPKTGEVRFSYVKIK